MRSKVLWVKTAILLAMFGLALTSMRAESPTFDEQGFLVRGLAYLRGEERGGHRGLRVGHPLGLNALNASLLVNDPTVVLPSADPSWRETSFHRPAELFLWEIGNDVEHIMFLARLPTLWLGLLMAAIAGRWAAEIVHLRNRDANRSRATVFAGLIGLVLLAFDPNVLAHMRLVTTDLGLAAAATIAGFALWHYFQRPSIARAAVGGIGLGLLLNTKFTALLFLPLFGLVALLGVVLSRRNRSFGTRALPISLAWKSLMVYVVLGFLALWIGNGVQTGQLSSSLPFVGSLGGADVPLSDYLDQLLDIGNRLEVSTPSFLLGRYSDSGWWFYFPVAFLAKTPLPTLLLLASALIFSLRELMRGSPEARFDTAALLIPPAGYFAIALTTDINLGYRHLLPVLPFLSVFIGTTLGEKLATAELTRRRVWPVATGILVGWLIVATIAIYPHYLAFFNVLVGGPNNGWRVLVDSNLDWGQDLKGLAEWQSKHNVGTLWLSYFGEARPEYYGIDYVGLDSFPPRLMDPEARPFFPDDPAPGWYAISATTLQGVHFNDHDVFRYFRQRKPSANIGHSILLFHVPQRGERVDILLGNLQLDELSADDFALLGSNAVIPRWFDAGQAVLLPDNSRSLWLALGDSELDPLLAPSLGLAGTAPTAESGHYRLYELAVPPRQDFREQDLLSLKQGNIAFGGEVQRVTEDGMLTLVSSWRQVGEPRPVKLFLHVLDEAGSIAAQWDGLDVHWQGWRPHDTLRQIHRIDLTGLPPGTYRLVTGAYDPSSLERWQSTSGEDFIELDKIVLP